MGVPISGLPAGTTLGATDELPAVQSATTKKITGQNVIDYINATATFLPLIGGTLSGSVVIEANLAATLSLAILNLNNANVLANAFQYLITGGSSGGDAATYWGVDSGGGFYVGVDNSDGDKWKLSNVNGIGVGDLITCDQTGNLVFTIPLALASGGTGANTYLGALRNLMGTTINTQSGTTYTAASATDAYRKTLLTNASGCTVTVNDSSFGIGDEAFYQRDSAAGVITFAAGGGVTINSSPASSLKINASNGGAWLFKSATNTYYIRGDLTP